ncbi:lasso peptide isopeptide bond-forming cyclase [Methanobacterium oryzae]|uniref:lasso peptide isopeptide bond-forming cyclase n=1 Tax=Methanobacterium oryzae TaxID=69540 RepID=UPI003D1C36B7
MSAITGIFYRDGRKVKPELIKKMNDRLSHRGPDGSAVWVNGSVAFGHQMLFTTHESLKEKLPFYDKKYGLAITADARIDNRKELSKELNIEDCVDNSDSYFIMEAYQKWGESCPEHLLGDFAFAICDENEEKLFCARDHMGVKPFYYYLDDKMFVFGTEIKALLNILEIPKQINEEKIGNYLSLIDEKNFTFYKSIYRLPATHSITIDFKRTLLNQYWNFPKKELILNSDEDYVQTFINIFTEAVNCRLRSAFSVGAELSGGLDSSSVVGVASEILFKNKKNLLKTFSLVFKDLSECDESLYINALLNDMKVEPHYSYGDLISPLIELENILWHNDEPFFAPGFGTFWDLRTKMKKSGSRVILSGLGGDDVISHGKKFLTQLLSEKKFITLLNEINGLSKNLEKSKLNLFLNIVMVPFIPEFLIRFYQTIYGNSHEMISDKVINKKFYERIDLHKHKKLSDNLKLNKIKTLSEYDNNVLRLSYLQREFEELDAYNAIFSLEFRYPFYDRRLIEFCLSLPPEQKIKNGWGRLILRRGMNNKIPSIIQWRSDKTDISINLDYTMLKFEKEFIENLVYKNKRIISNYIDMNSLNKFFNEYTSGKDAFLSYLFLRIIILDSWLQKTEQEGFHVT